MKYNIVIKMLVLFSLLFLPTLNVFSFPSERSFETQVKISNPVLKPNEELSIDITLKNLMSKTFSITHGQAFRYVEVRDTNGNIIKTTKPSYELLVSHSSQLEPEAEYPREKMREYLDPITLTLKNPGYYTLIGYSEFTVYESNIFEAEKEGMDIANKRYLIKSQPMIIKVNKQ